MRTITALIVGAIALFAWVGTAAAQSSPQSGYDQQYNGTVGGWGNTTVGADGRPYIKRLAIINGTTETEVIDNTADSQSPDPALGMTVTAVVEGYNICGPGQSPGPGAQCYEDPNRIAITLSRSDGGGWSTDFTGATTTPQVDENSIVDLTIGFRPAYTSLRWTWLSGVPSWWSYNVTAAGGEVRVRYRIAKKPILDNAGYQTCGTQIPVESCTTQRSQAEILDSSMILSMDDTVNAVFTGALFATTNAIIGSLDTPPVMPGTPPMITYGVAAPHLFADGTARTGDFYAVLPDSILAAFGTSSAVFDSTIMSVVRTNDPSGGAFTPTWTQWTAAANGSDGELLTISPLTFSAPKFQVTSKAGKFGTVKKGRKITLKKLARQAGLKPGRLKAKLAKGKSKTYCKVVGASVKGLKKGACRVVITSTPVRGKRATKTVGVVIT